MVVWVALLVMCARQIGGSLPSYRVMCSLCRNGEALAYPIGVGAVSDL